MALLREKIARAMLVEADNEPQIFIQESEAERLRDTILSTIEAEGFVIVPRAPSRSMLSAGQAAPFNKPWPENTADIWRAMIDASNSSRDESNG